MGKTGPLESIVVHDATAKKLEEFGLLARLRETKNVLLMGLTGHSAFVNLMANAEFVVTGCILLVAIAVFTLRYATYKYPSVKRPVGAGAGGTEDMG